MAEVRKVLIVGPAFHSYMQSIQRAFRDLGWEADVIETFPKLETDLSIYHLIYRIFS